ncbi:D-inositol-3-phosphate glycosyltransferase [Ralstonia edaphis]|uniref:glycosyltransferase family 4 protein n=1 Tax=Ralstonia edaphi TaxID=3058599 RepID=UPI0028F5C790|nr:glycosyltransferase family 1 protein [Ralstonia sp. LMG 6871]CAJ0713976.1 D-inositol-3-phosphate glycosyltransferase [Ralstonia sp. LMG 6871]
MIQQDAPTIWMNVTTSANWKRPPVGIVRVERTLCDELEKLVGRVRFKRCVWHDGQFIEWDNSDQFRTQNNEDVLNIIFPKTPSFDIARGFLKRTIERFGDKSKGSNRTSVNLTIPLDKHNKISPTMGDILISIGLDWDQPYTSEFYKLAKQKGVRIITCCYDLIPVLFPQYCVGDVAQRFKEYFNMLTWGSDAVLCISEQSKKDFLRVCNEIGSPERPAYVIPMGDNVPSGRGQLSEDVRKILSENFILFVSTIERRKNHEVLYRAYHQLCRQGHSKQLPQLVFVGMAGWGVGELLKDIELDPVTQGKITQLNHVSDYELMALYKHALFCAFPSLYEGWGLPVGEALAMGKAVLCSDQGSLPEVGGDLVKYLPPWNTNAWAQTIYEWSTNPEHIKLMENRVSAEYAVRKWSNTARVVHGIIEELLAQQKNKAVIVYPGYDCSSQVGIHIGATIQGAETPGFLMFGPHRSIAPGQYIIKIFGVPSSKSGQLHFDFVANEGKLEIWSQTLQALPEMEKKEKVFVEFSIDIPHHLQDYEIRCIDSGTDVQLTRIEIDRSRTE